MTEIGQFDVPPDHPALSGHFPGRPVLPGVVLLDHVTEAVARVAKTRVTGFPQVKFLTPVRPGDQVTILSDAVSHSGSHSGRIAFTCRVGDTTVATGTATLAPRPGDE